MQLTIPLPAGPEFERPPHDFQSIRAMASDSTPCTGTWGPYRLASHFQPIVSFCYRRIVGYEALMRPQDGLGRPIAPPVLLAMAERNGRLEELDRLCRYVHVANHTSLALPDGWLFLNIHPSLFGRPRDGQGAGFTESLIKHFKVSPSRIVVEVLEEAVLDDASFEAGVQHLRELGCGIALDDFGAGHSNFERIWRIRPDIVKLDRSYAVRAAEDPSARRMLPSIVALLHEAGSMVLLEGIETAEQALIAMDADVDFAQGWYFARSAAPENLIDVSVQEPLDAVWQAYDEHRQTHQGRYRDMVGPYLNALGYAATLLAAGRTMQEACAGFLELPRSERCYLLDSTGCQVSRNLLTRRIAPTPALVAFQNTSQARWSRRPYFHRALEHPGSVQITRPYRSIASSILCVTVSASMLINGTPHVLCGDVVWDDAPMKAPGKLKA